MLSQHNVKFNKLWILYSVKGLFTHRPLFRVDADTALFLSEYPETDEGVLRFEIPLFFSGFEIFVIETNLIWKISGQLDVTSYYVLFHFFYVQHVSDINTSIIILTMIVLMSETCWA